MVFLYSPAEMTEIAEMSLIDRLREFLETEARSCSMDYGCITPEYVQRAWGGRVAIEDITQGLTELLGSGDVSLIRCLLAPLMWRNPVQSYS